MSEKAFAAEVSFLEDKIAAAVGDEKIWLKGLLARFREFSLTAMA